MECGVGVQRAACSGGTLYSDAAVLDETDDKGEEQN